VAVLADAARKAGLNKTCSEAVGAYASCIRGFFMLALKCGWQAE